MKFSQSTREQRDLLPTALREQSKSKKPWLTLLQTSRAIKMPGMTVSLVWTKQLRESSTKFANKRRLGKRDVTSTSNGISRSMASLLIPTSSELSTLHPQGDREAHHQDHQEAHHQGINSAPGVLKEVEDLQLSLWWNRTRIDQNCIDGNQTLSDTNIHNSHETSIYRS